MTIVNLITRQTFAGNGALVLFSIPFNFQPGTASDVTKVIHIDNAAVETTLVEGTDYTLTPLGDNPTNADLSTGSAPFGAPAADEFIRMERRTPKTQETDFDSAGSGTPYNPTALEDSVDKSTRQLQELSEDVDELIVAPAVVVTSTAIIPDWLPATDYLIDNVVVDPTTIKMYRALTDHTSGGSFNIDFVAGDWELLETSGIDGATGPQGPTGLTGAPGATGAAGAAGADGADGIFAAIADQAEAETGTNNTKGMSPLRTKQAVTFQLPLHADIISMKARITVNEADIQDLKNRVVNLESFATFALGKFAGSQKLANLQVAPIELLGLLSPTAGSGKGDKFLRDGDGTEFAEVQVYIKRTNVLGDVRFSSFDLIMQFVDGVWFIGRDGTVQLEQTLDLDGVILSIVTNGANEGQVFYTSDDMGGGDDPFHFENSVIKWWGQEIPIGI